MLLQVPWQARHAVAAATDPGQAYQLLQLYAGEEGALMAAMDLEATVPNADYRRRVDAWLGNAMTDDELYAAAGFEVRDAAVKAMRDPTQRYGRTERPR